MREPNIAFHRTPFGNMASVLTPGSFSSSAARASQDLKRPGSILVDLIVNGSPAPLVFHPRHDDLSAELDEHWPAGDTEGAGVGEGVPGATGGANDSRATGWESETGKREMQPTMIQRRKVQEPRENEEDVLEIQASITTILYHALLPGSTFEPLCLLKGLVGYSVPPTPLSLVNGIVERAII